mmetsp:Transcript_28068/g.38449  ORF Transcript_28068/g.38449 Transcript_28068/m.38449 type:complete len:81 (-) Transcript_28068:90-332(-)
MVIFRTKSFIIHSQVRRLETTNLLKTKTTVSNKYLEPAGNKTFVTDDRSTKKRLLRFQALSIHFTCIGSSEYFSSLHFKV